jgi:hypothetical protein
LSVGTVGGRGSSWAARRGAAEEHAGATCRTGVRGAAPLHALCALEEVATHWLTTMFEALRYWLGTRFCRETVRQQPGRPCVPCPKSTQTRSSNFCRRACTTPLLGPSLTQNRSASITRPTYDAQRQSGRAEGLLAAEDNPNACPAAPPPPTRGAPSGQPFPPPGPELSRAARSTP